MDEYLIHPDYIAIPDGGQPASPLEALMRAQPGEEPEESILETNVRREALGRLLDHAMGQLTELEQEIVTACVIERVPLRKLAERLEREGRIKCGKTWVAHLRDEALGKLRVLLQEDVSDLQRWEE